MELEFGIRHWNSALEFGIGIRHWNSELKFGIGIPIANTPGTAGGPGGRDRTLVVKSRKIAKISVFFFSKKKLPKIFFCIYLLYAKILGETNFHPREFPRSGLKAKDGEKKIKRENTPGTAGGPGGRDRRLAVKRRKNARK